MITCLTYTTRFATSFDILYNLDSVLLHNCYSETSIAQNQFFDNIS